MSRTEALDSVWSQGLPPTMSTTTTGSGPSAARMTTRPRGRRISCVVETRIGPGPLRTTSPDPPAAIAIASASVATGRNGPPTDTAIGPEALPGLSGASATGSSGSSPAIGRSSSFFRLAATTAAIPATAATTTSSPIATGASFRARGGSATFRRGFGGATDASGFGSAFGLLRGLAAVDNAALSGASGPMSSANRGPSGSEPDPRSGLASATAGAGDAAVATAGTSVAGMIEGDPGDDRRPDDEADDPEKPGAGSAYGSSACAASTGVAYRSSGRFRIIRRTTSTRPSGTSPSGAVSGSASWSWCA